eukprot:Seg15267.1 transcript_id=Seg15267.1/GoldUCD/mRNA.D3Y31 product="hypothetical protein" protein_id=Seg15267.1/GoldUCD/D3Y31
MTPCKDTSEKLVRDQVAHWERLAFILDQAVEGKTSITETDDLVKEWEQEGEKLMERAKKINASLSHEEQIKAHELASDKYRKQIDAANQRVSQAMTKLEQLGKITPKIEYIVRKMYY